MAKRRNQIAGQFVSRPRQLVESSAMRVLSLAAHQALMRIEVEHMSHGGKENGKLPVTYRLPADLSPGVECQGYWHPRIPEDRLSRAGRGRRGGGPQGVGSSQRGAWQKEFCHPPKRPKATPQNVGRNGKFPPPKTWGTCPPPKTWGTFYISGRYPHEIRR